MAKDNFGSQSGDHSINVGVGDFRGANFHGRDSTDGRELTPEELGVRRRIVFGHPVARIRSVKLFTRLSGLCSIGSFVLVILPLVSSSFSANWAPMALVVSLILWAPARVLLSRLTRSRFEVLLLRRLYLEVGEDGRVYLTRLTATCPFCHAPMELVNEGPDQGPRINRFICRRNPTQHAIEVDPTALPEVS